MSSSLNTHGPWRNLTLPPIWKNVADTLDMGIEAVWDDYLESHTNFDVALAECVAGAIKAGDIREAQIILKHMEAEYDLGLDYFNHLAFYAVNFGDLSIVGQAFGAWLDNPQVNLGLAQEKLPELCLALWGRGNVPPQLRVGAVLYVLHVANEHFGTTVLRQNHVLTYLLENTLHSFGPLGQGGIVNFDIQALLEHMNQPTRVKALHLLAEQGVEEGYDHQRDYGSNQAAVVRHILTTYNISLQDWLDRPNARYLNSTVDDTTLDLIKTKTPYQREQDFDVINHLLALDINPTGIEKIMPLFDEFVPAMQECVEWNEEETRRRYPALAMHWDHFKLSDAVEDKSSSQRLSKKM